MSTLTVLQAGRDAAENLMRTTVRVTRQTGEVTYDGLKPVRGDLLIYEGKGKIQSYEGYEQERTSAGANVVVVRVRLDIPVGVAVIEPGDHVEVLACLDDPQLVGERFRVSALAPYKSMATAYRVFVDLIERG